MGPHNKQLSRLLSYPIIGLLLAACGAASSPVAGQATASTATPVMLTTTAMTMASPMPTMAPSSTIAPAVTAVATDTPMATAAIAPTGTTAPPAMTTPPATPVPVAATATLAQPSPPPAAAGAKVPAQIKLFQFKPNVLEIKAGTTVVWTNQDAIEHSVTSGTPPAASGVFDSGFFTQGQSFTFTFTKPGTYTYFCMRHNSMTGTLVVK